MSLFESQWVSLDLLDFLSQITTWILQTGFTIKIKFLKRLTRQQKLLKVAKTKVCSSKLFQTSAFLGASDSRCKSENWIEWKLSMMLLKKKIWDLNFHFAKFLSFWKLQEINPEFSRVQLNFVTKSSDVNSHVISVKTNESKTGQK